MVRILMASILVALLAACGSTADSGDGISGSGTPVSRSFDLDGFTQIDANNSAQVEVTRGDVFSVQVEVDDNLAPLLEVEVAGDTLHVRLQTGTYSNVTLRAWVTMPELTGVTLNGGSALQAAVEGEDLALDLNGASQATLTGTAGRVTLVANGGSQALLGDLASGDVTLDANGASHVEINSGGAVTGQANGASTVTVTGSPTSVDVETDGASRVDTR